MLKENNDTEETVDTATFCTNSQQKLEYFKELAIDVMAVDSLDVEEIVESGETLYLVTIRGHYLVKDYCEITAEHAGVRLVGYKQEEKQEKGKQ